MDLLARFLGKQLHWIKKPSVEINGSRGGAAHQVPWKNEKTADGFFRIPFILSPHLRKIGINFLSPKLYLLVYFCAQDKY